MKGKVYLVGAGPGDYKLLTLRGKECIQEAEVIVYDRLVNLALLSFAKESCEFINVGKAANLHTLPQDEINALLVKKAKEGKTVVRLKGGDPYVFGRGGEEGCYLEERDIPFEVVPGITSAIGGLCYAGIPITHRNYASSFHVITGHLKEEGSQAEDWENLAKLKGTLVFLMGVSQLEHIVKSLIEKGKSSETPVAIISWATRAKQKVMQGTLENIVELAKEEAITPPSLIVMGEVVKLRETLNFFEKRPLLGKTVVVTRTRSQCSELGMRLMDLGAEVIECPTLAIEKLHSMELVQSIKVLHSYTHLVFTSQHAVKFFFEALNELGLDSRALAGIKVAVIGNVTAKVLMDYGIKADFVPEQAVAEELYKLLEGSLKPEDRLLLPQSQQARDYLHKALSQHCTVDAINIYTNSLPKLEAARSFGYSMEDVKALIAQGKIDYITFASSSAVSHFISLMGQSWLLNKTKLVSIGEVTSKTIWEAGLKVYKEAKKSSIQGLIDALIE